MSTGMRVGFALLFAGIILVLIGSVAAVMAANNEPALICPPGYDLTTYPTSYGDRVWCVPAVAQ